MGECSQFKVGEFRTRGEAVNALVAMMWESSRKDVLYTLFDDVGNLLLNVRVF